MSGRVSKTVKREIQVGFNIVEVDVQGLNSGMYTLMIYMDDQLHTVEKITKK